MFLLQINSADLQRATRNLLDQGIIGSLLFLAVVIIIALIVLGRKNYNRQLLDKDRHIMKLESEKDKEVTRFHNEIEDMRRGYRENIEGALQACQNAINRGDKTIDENTKVLSEIRMILIKILESKL